jgi:hypothetical protein
MRQRPGFVSATGIVLAIIVLAGVLAVAVFAGPQLFSPGGLNAQTGADLASSPAPKATQLGGVSSHAELSGDCGACHPAPWSNRTMADACLACHTGVGDEIKAKDGLHGRLEGMQAAPTCTGCHPEHNGPDGALTVLDEAGFGPQHDLTGFSLKTHQKTDSGGSFTCADCHRDGYSGAYDQALCADCHADIDAAFIKDHEAAFGNDCLGCHDGTGNTKVDHDTFAFKLAGKHAAVPCEDCHKDARSLKQYQDAPTDCYGCHAKDDEHDGAYGRDCGSCHTAQGWDDVTFDHKVFPLDHGSEEKRPTCETCHPNGTDTYTCYGCHEHTQSNVVGEHEGQSLAELQDCVRCHQGGGDGEGGD